MVSNYNKVYPVEKIISVLSYLSMGIIGVVWLIASYVLKRKSKYFLMYNISQSMLISIIYAIIMILSDIIIKITFLIPFMIFIGNFIKNIIYVKKFYFLFFSFSIFQFLVFILLCYIIVGIFAGRIFYIPVLTKIMNKAMKSYE